MTQIDPKFIKHLTDWLKHSDQKDAKYLYENRLKVPQIFRKYSKTLYRGTVVDESFFEDLERGVVRLNAYTSWSKDKRISIGFLADPKYKISTRGGTPILIKKSFIERDIIMDIHGFMLFAGKTSMLENGVEELAIDSAIKEHEVLINKGIAINKRNVTIL